MVTIGGATNYNTNIKDHWSQTTMANAIMMEKYVFFSFLGPHPWHMEFSRLGGESELQLMIYTTATAMWDLNHICHLHQSSQPCWILSLLRPGIKPIYSWILAEFVSTVP